MGYLSFKTVIALALCLVLTVCLVLTGCKGDVHKEAASHPGPSNTAPSTQVLEVARMALSEGMFTSALAFADSALAIDPDAADAQFLRGQVLFQMRDIAGAESAFESTLALQEDYPSAWFNLGNISFLRRKYSEAISRYDNEMAVTERQSEQFGVSYAVRYQETMSRLAVQKGRAHRQLAEDEAAVSAFRAALAFDSLNADAYADLSQSLKDAGKTDEALQYAEQAVSLVPVHPDYNYLLGALKQEAGEVNAAVPLLQRSLQLKPWLASARYSLGLALVELGEEDAGKLQLQLADTLQVLNDRIEKARFESQTYPDQVQRWLTLSRLLIQAGRVDEAVRPLSVAESLRPEDLSIKNDLANLALVRGDTLDAIQKFKILLSTKPDYAEGWYNLGVVYALQTKYSQARAAWEEALKHDPAHRDARSSIERLPGP